MKIKHSCKRGGENQICREQQGDEQRRNTLKTYCDSGIRLQHGWKVKLFFLLKLDNSAHVRMDYSDQVLDACIHSITGSLNFVSVLEAKLESLIRMV